MNRSAIVVVVDFLNPGQMGPYGAGEPRTPALNRFASQSRLADFCFADSLELRPTYRGYWRGLHSLIPDGAADPSCRGASLPELCARAGLSSALLTEGTIPELAPESARFARQEIWEAELPEKLAGVIEETRLARFMEHAIGFLETQSRTPGLTWLHLSSLGTCWDAPLELREALVDESDPTPSRSPHPPHDSDLGTNDPDAILGLRVAYAAQVAVFDACLDLLASWFLDRPPTHPTMCLVTSPRGMPLGLHGEVGPRARQLYQESLHLPLIVATPEFASHPGRCAQLLQPPCVYRTLVDWLGIEPPSPPDAEPFAPIARPFAADEVEFPSERQFAVARWDRQFGLRTPAWYLKTTATNPGDARDESRDPGPVGFESVELYAKPDDRWEMNEISSRCREVTGAMQETLQRFLRAAEIGRLDTLEPLDGSLRAHAR